MGRKNKELLLNGWPRVTAEAPSFFPIIFVFIREKITNQVERKRERHRRRIRIRQTRWTGGGVAGNKTKHANKKEEE
jgi:hypothetical protein